MEASVSSTANCWDSTVLDRFFGSLKSECLADQRGLTRQQARQDIVQCVEMEYNSSRLHSTLGYMVMREPCATSGPAYNGRI